MSDPSPEQIAAELTKMADDCTVVPGKPSRIFSGYIETLRHAAALLRLPRVESREEFDRLFQAVEGYRVGALNRAGLMHYYEIARQFRIAHPEIIRAPDETRPQHPQRVITTDTVTGVQSERLLSAGNSSTPAPKEGRCHYCNRICADCFHERQINTGIA